MHRFRLRYNIYGPYKGELGGVGSVTTARMPVVFLISAAFHCALILAVIEGHGFAGGKCAAYETVVEVALVDLADNAETAATPYDAGHRELGHPSRKESLPLPLRADSSATENAPTVLKKKNRVVHAKASSEAERRAAETDGTADSVPASSAEASAGPADTGHGEDMKRGYLIENFLYIKNRITRHLSYPPVARRLKWQGIAVVTFYILENGLVENIKIASSSGHQLLDNHVIDTVKHLQPFPKPPVRAEITIPVKYILSD
jgi:TonB family protein